VSEVLPDIFALLEEFQKLYAANLVTEYELNYLVMLTTKCFQFMFGVAHGLSYMLYLCHLGHGLPTLSFHNLEITLFESPEDKVTPSKASQHELLYMQFTKFFIATSQQKNEKLFCYKVLLKGSKIQLEYWLVDGCEWPELQNIVTKLFSMATSSATAEQNFSTMGFIHSKLCNILRPKTTEKLVFIKSNLAAFYNLLQVVEYDWSDSGNENY
jgi:hAT family C-terminal dimerisation region